MSIVLTITHHQIAVAAGQYTSWCTVNETVDCSRVLSSAQAYLFGIPVAVWGGLASVSLGILTAVTVWSPRYSRRFAFAQLTMALAGWNAVFSAYMAWISLFVIESICLLCTSMYVVNATALAAAWSMFTVVRSEGRREQGSVATKKQRWAVFGATSVIVIAVLAFVAWKALRPEAVPETLDEIQQANRQFYDWYTSQPVASVAADGRNAKGDGNAPVTIVEFSDFQCGHCAAAYRVMKEVLPRYSGKVRVVFRHFPLDSACNGAVTGRAHPYACAAAIAAECAADQGRFWEYHDLLFENQTRLDSASLVEYAQRLDLDMAAFDRCTKSPAAKARVENDLKEGERLKIDSTPTMFVNGRTVRGSLAPELLRYAIGIEKAKS